MTFQPPSVGTLSKFGLDTASPVAHAYEYKSFGLGKHNTVLSTDGIRGTRSHPVERTRAGVYTISGSIVTEPGPTDLDAFLPLILGGSPTGSPTITYPVAETVGAFNVTLDRVAAGHTDGGCKVDTARFSAQQGSILELAMEIEGLTETIGAVSGFSALVPSLQSPFVLMDAALTYNSTSYQFRGFSVAVHNSLKKDRFMNNSGRTDLPALDRIVEVELSLPYTSDTTGLYDNNVTSGAVVITFTNGSNVFTITLPAVQFPTEPPDTPGRDEILLPLRGIARKTGTTSEITCTNNP